MLWRARAKASVLVAVDKDVILGRVVQRILLRRSPSHGPHPLRIFHRKCLQLGLEGGVANGTALPGYLNLMPLPADDLNANSNLEQKSGILKNEKLLITQVEMKNINILILGFVLMFGFNACQEDPIVTINPSAETGDMTFQLNQARYTGYTCMNCWNQIMIWIWMPCTLHSPNMDLQQL